MPRLSLQTLKEAQQEACKTFQRNCWSKNRHRIEAGKEPLPQKYIKLPISNLSELQQQSNIRTSIIQNISYSLAKEFDFDFCLSIAKTVLESTDKQGFLVRLPANKTTDKPMAPLLRKAAEVLSHKFDTGNILPDSLCYLALNPVYCSDTLNAWAGSDASMPDERLGFIGSLNLLPMPAISRFSESNGEYQKILGIAWQTRAVTTIVRDKPCSAICQDLLCPDFHLTSPNDTIPGYVTMETESRTRIQHRSRVGIITLSD